MRRLVVLVVLVAAVAGGVYLIGEQREATGEAGAVLQHPDRQEADPSFATSDPAARGLPLADVAARPSDLAPAPAAAATLDVLVRHADGVPAAGCAVVVAPAHGASWHATTDRSGIASGPQVESEGVAWVDGPTLQPQRFPLATRQGRVELTLPDGELLAGHALIDDAPPDEPFALGLGPRPEENDVPTVIAEQLVHDGLGTRAIEEQPGLLVGRDGAFRFSGLPRDWRGDFALPEDLAEAEGEKLVATAGEEDRVLRLRRLPRVLLRVLMPSGEPAAQAQIDATVRAPSGSTERTFTADEAGRVSFPMLRWEATESVDVAAVDTAGTARIKLTRPVPDSTRDFDLGDVTLEQAWTWTFRALDPKGAPLAGAVGGTVCELLVQSEPTGADGVGTLPGVPAGCPELRVGAPRCEIATVALPARPPSAPLDVILQPCANLEVHVVAADGQPRPGLTVYFHTATRAARWLRDDDFGRTAHALGITHSPRISYTTTSNAGGPQSIEIGRDQPVPESGVVIVGCVEPGEPIDLLLLDRTRTVLWSREGFTLQAAEQAVVTIPVSATPGSLDVAVTDGQGAPVGGAEVRLLPQGKVESRMQGDVDRLPTDAAGHCHFDELYAQSADLECSCHGFATLRLPVIVAAGAVSVVLGTGLSVTLHVVDEQGRPAPVPYASIARTDGQRLVQVVTRLDPSPTDENLHSTFRFDDLPEVPLLVMTTLSGRTIRVPHDPHLPEARLVVPATGSLVVRGLHPDPQGGRFHLVAEWTTDEPGRINGWLDDEELAAGLYRWPLMLPGAYRISLVRSGAEGNEEVIRGPVPAEVRAGEETAVDLR